jgi:hypothetical protein
MRTVLVLATTLLAVASPNGFVAGQETAREAVPLSPTAEAELESLLLADDIKCRVCAATISHIWQTGEALRRNCEANPRTDRLCLHDDVQSQEVVHLVETSCEHLSRTHGPTKATDKLGVEKFDLVRRRHHPKWRHALDRDAEIDVAGSDEEPSRSHPGDHHFHSEEDAETLQSVCNKWLYERHSAEKIAAHVFTNLQAGKKEHDIVRFLRRRFCFPACGNGSRRMLKAPRWDDEL